MRPDQRVRFPQSTTGESLALLGTPGVDCNTLVEGVDNR